MPELHSYPVDSSNELADYQLGDKYETPLDTGLAAHLSRGFSVGPSSIYNAFGVGLEDSAMFKGYEADGTPIPNEWIDAKTAKSRYGISINSGQKISDLSAQRIAQFKAADEERNAKINRMSTDFGTQALGFGAEMLGSLLDPISIGASFIPFVGEARGLMLMERFGPTAGRLLIGGIEGALGNAILEPLTYSAAKTLNYEYDAFDSFMNIAAGGIIGAGFHAGFGKVADHFGFSAWSKHIEAGRIEPEIHHTALRTAVGQALQDQTIQVSPIIRLALDEAHPNMDAISAIKLIKSAESSAEVFQSQFRAEDALLNYRNDMVGLLSESEKNIFQATSTKDLLDAQLNLGKDINTLTAQLDEFQQLIEEVHPAQKPAMARQMEAVANELEQKRSLLEDLHGTRKLTDELIKDLRSREEALNPESRSNLNLQDLNIEDQNLMLNIEKYKDANLANLDKLDFNSIQSESDKVLLRRAVLAAQDLNNLDKVTSDQLIDMATKQGTLEGKWYYEPEISRQIEENVKAAPKNYDDVDAQKQLDDIMGTIDNLKRAEAVSESELEQLDLYDENIKKSESFGNALKSAANCVIKGFI